MAGTPHVLQLGGGYVAITLSRALREPIRRGELCGTVVSRENFHAFHGFVGEMVTGRIGPGNMLSPARRIFPPCAVHVAEIEEIDLTGNRVVTSRHLDGVRTTLEYDHLVIGLGTTENLEIYPGLAEHAFKLKAYADCLRLRNHLLEMFELAEIESDPEERRRLLTFVVAGGGYSGTELAGELADFARLLTSREYSRIGPDEWRVVLVHHGATIMPEFHGTSSYERGARAHPRLVAYATRHARALGVELLTETSVAAATPNEVFLSNGMHVPTRTIVSTCGTRPQPVLEALGLPSDEHGRVLTDRYLRVEGFENVWAGGDCAAVAHPHGGTCPPVGLYALKHGARIGSNIRRAAGGLELEPYDYSAFAAGISIGGRNAVGEVRGIPLRGKAGWILWRAILVYFLPTWDRRLRLLADWVIWPLVGRDIVELEHAPRSDYEVRHEVFDAGETLAHVERPVRYIHVILEGDVELVRNDEVVGALNAGSHFGRKVLELHPADEARAVTRVRTLSLREDQAEKLHDLLASAGRLRARTASFEVEA
ncbi:MAG TPA: FAD-dependent oxidoreductase [Gaiellaceae bacterium]|jgi:NADH dehydrogenase|nr:FAD-dependent oxidoreductase [Gaiellaceae bacterium]